MTEMKKIAMLLVVAGVTLLLASCHKECVCTGFDGIDRTYTDEEVDAQGGSCSNMVIQARTRFYSYCRWE